MEVRARAAPQEMEDEPSIDSAGGDAECTDSKSALMSRLERLRTHHNLCRQRSEKSLKDEYKENLAASDTEDEDHMSELDAASSTSLTCTQASGRSDTEMSLVIEESGELHTTKESSQTKRRKWTKEEIQAVERTLMDYISSGKVPGKAQCLECIQTSPIALKGRSWEGVKFYVKNRIDALKCDSVKIS